MTEREEEVLNMVIEIIKKYLVPTKIILFGSRAKNKSKTSTDFDIAVDKEMKNLTLHRKIMEEIEKIAGLYKIDLIYLNSVDKDFKEIILKTGKIAYERRN